MKMGTAIILTNGILDDWDAKTAHGLVRGTERFNILGVIDSNSVGRDAGVVVDGIKRNIPVYSSVDDYLEISDQKPDYCIVGVALSGGRFDEEWQALLLDVMSKGISIVNGLHMLLGDIPLFLESAEPTRWNLLIFDVRNRLPNSIFGMDRSMR
jgi:uncharacterized NAD-dependent epimerase/dehydratase family protein